MSNIFLDDVVSDPDLAEYYTIERSVGGAFLEGGYEDKKQTVKMWGVVSKDIQRDLDMVPEGDRLKELRAFWSTQPIFTTNENGISDVIIWQGERFRVVAVANYSNRRYWKAIAARTKGM